MSLEDVLGGFEESNNDEEATMKAINQLLDNQDIELKSEVGDSARLSLLLGMKEQFEKDGLKDHSKLLKNFVQKFLEYQVSKNRQSRKEVVEILKDKKESKEDEEKKKLEQLLEKR